MKNLGRRKFLLAGIDLLILIISCFITYFVVNVSTDFNLKAWDIIWNMVVFVILNSLSLNVWGTYNKVWRYANVKDLLYCAFSMLTGSALSIILLFIFQSEVSILYLLLSSLFAFCGVLGARLLYLYLLYVVDMHVFSARKRKTLIVGGGQACQSILNEMLRIPSCDYDPVCIVDDDVQKIGRSISGIKIYGPTSEIPKLCKTYDIQVIIFAIPSCTEEERKNILKICSETTCKIKILPYIHKLIFNKNLLSQTTDIELEDLLGRDPVEFNNQSISQLIEGKVCMVTGGGGSIGSELCRQIMRYCPKKLLLVDIYENNAYDIQQELQRQYGYSLPLDVRIASVRDYPRMEQLFQEYHPDIVFHAAAHKHVPLMEDNPEEAVKNNIFGTFHVAELAKLYRVQKFVMVSTDKAVNPTNVMGATKRCCEMIMQYMSEISDYTEFVSVRFGNVLGSNGSVIPLFRKQIEAGGPVTVTHPDIIRYFMTIPEAVSLILQAGYMAKGGEIFVLDMGEPVKITTLAENLIRLYGKEPYEDIEIQFIGLRPGEKLFEELLMDEEGLKSTMNHKIFIGNQIYVDKHQFIQKLDQLHELLEENDNQALISCLQEIVPTFYHSEAVQTNVSEKVRTRISQ